MLLNIDHLPKTARDIAAVVGLPATLALVERFGGRSLPIPKRNDGARFHELSEVIGEPATRKLADTFGGSEAPIPKCVAAIRAVTHNALRADFDQITKKGQSARFAVTTLAETYSYTERYVWRVLAQADTAGEITDCEGQIPLF